MKKLNKICLALGLMVCVNSAVWSQSIATWELQSTTAPTNSGFGTSTLPMIATFKKDSLNSNVFSNVPTGVKMTASLQKQQLTGFSYGDPLAGTLINTGMVFGAGPTNGYNSALGPDPLNRYDILGAYNGSFGPTDSMFTSSPSALGPQNGTGIRVAYLPPFTNGGIEIFNQVYELFKRHLSNKKDSSIYYGQLKLAFSQTVVNPVIHLGGLGGSLRYVILGANPNSNNPADWRTSYFTTELQLVTPGVTSTKMSGNQNFIVDGVNNKILNAEQHKPNGASVSDPAANIPPSFNDFGAATGSVRINGLVDSLVYNVYMRGGDSSQFAWGIPVASIQGGIVDPFAGDIWYVSASMNKPSQQISGKVFNDKDGLTDNSIYSSTSLGLTSNLNTNSGGLLWAKLINNLGVVIDSIAVNASGLYLFDNVPVGTYTVKITSKASTGNGDGALPPSGLQGYSWRNTGDIVGLGSTNTPGDGISSTLTVNANDVIQNVNFGIQLFLGAGECLSSQLHFDQTNIDASNFGSFEAGNQNFNSWITGTLPSNLHSRFRATTSLQAAQYSFSHSPLIDSSAFDAFLPLHPQNASPGTKMMLVKNPSPNSLVWSLIDTTDRLHIINPIPLDSQYYFKSGLISTYSGFLTRVKSDSPVVIRIMIYDADSNKVFPHTTFFNSKSDTTITLTGTPGIWQGFSIQPILDSFRLQKSRSWVKKIRWDIISVNGQPFAMDNLQLCDGLVILPIKLTSFTATKQANSVLLNWQTSSENNSKNFEVLHSKDAVQWQTIGIVAAAGISSSARNYSLVDNNPLKGANYYRLKSVDLDNRSELSDVRLVVFGAIDGIKVLPNPVVDKVFITASNSNRLQSVALFSSDGKMLRQIDNFLPGNSVDMSTYASGTYLLKITDKQGVTEVVRVVKVGLK